MLLCLLFFRISGGGIILTFVIKKLECAYLGHRVEEHIGRLHECDIVRVARRFIAGGGVGGRRRDQTEQRVTWHGLGLNADRVAGSARLTACLEHIEANCGMIVGDRLAHLHESLHCQIDRFAYFEQSARSTFRE